MDDDQIRTILTEQDLYGGRFGEIAVMKGWVPEGTVNLLLNPQSMPPKENGSRLNRMKPVTDIL